VSDSDAVDVPADERDTVTPNLVVTPGTPTATQVPFTVSASNPATGATITPITVELIGTTSASGGNPPGVYSVASGSVIFMDRPAFSTTSVAAIRVTASVAGGGSVTIQRTVPNQVKDAFGPSLQLNLTIGPTSCSIAYTVIGTLEVSIDGGTWATAGASPITGITRDSSPHTYDFRAFADGRYAPGSVAIPAITAAVSPFGGLALGNPNYTFDTVRLDWSWTGDSGAGFDVYFSEHGSAFDLDHHVAPGTVSTTLVSSENLTATGTSLPMKAYLVAIVGDNVVATSASASFTATYTP
jgi:hypothetical protein